MGMKIAVSIPDQIFAEAEALARRFRTSRSELYSRALGLFIGLHAPDRVTAAMNAVIDDVGPEPDPVARETARRVLSKMEW